MSAVPQMLNAQSQKAALTLENLQEWRNNSLSLSDDGSWYTVLYSQLDKSESKEDTLKEKLAEKLAEAYYTEENQTDILYIYHSKNGLTYKIPKASKPIFSPSSDWIAYQIKPESDKKAKEKAKPIIELKELGSDFTLSYESTASFRFLEDKNYFITSDKNSLLIYDLENKREHYIGNIGEYLIDEKSARIFYTIATEDKRGNGIYLYDPSEMTSRALQTGNFTYSNLAWNEPKKALAAYKYTQDKEEIDFAGIHILIASEIDTKAISWNEYVADEIKGMPENMVIGVKNESASNEIRWSEDGERLFIKIKKQEAKKEEKEEGEKISPKESSVQIWHGKDKKLLSERITEKERNKNKVFDAIFFLTSNSISPLTGEEMQNLILSQGTDNWAIGTDNRAYISDWDVNKNDLYRINLQSGEKKLLQKAYKSRFSSGLEISPDGKKAILWEGGHYWAYDFETDQKHSISEGIEVSFVDKDYDKYGFIPDYGFVGWVKGQNAVIVNHKWDIWFLPLDKGSQAKNLTASISEPIRFRFEDRRFAYEDEIEERYIDLASPNILSAFHTKTKYAGFYSLEGDKLKKLIYEASNFSSFGWTHSLLKSKKSDVIIYKVGDYQNYPEAYLSTAEFSKPKKLTNTNPQQEKYSWGERILIEYSNDDGVPLQAILSIPNTYKKGQKLPMIVYSYEKLSNNLYRYASPYLSGASVPEMLYVSDGYLFLQPDIHFNVGTPHSDMHECIEAAINKVIEVGYVDEKRIGYEGFSFGGHCGMYISTQKNKFAAIAAGAGVSNLVQGFNIDIVWDGSNEQDYYMTGQGRLGTDPTGNIDMFITESAVFNANTMNTPLLLFHGTADKVVQWEHSFGFYSILRYLKKPVIFLSYKGEGHGLRKEGNRFDIQQRLKAYFDHHLRDAEVQKWMLEDFPLSKDPDPKKEEKDSRKLPKWK
ncbi:MAG: prolyl oligopeptidase family serine peptidase [Bacteroidota bacterium]